MTTPIKNTPKNLLTKRDNVIADIKNSWSIIATNNVFPVGMKQKYDLNAVYGTIVKAEKTLVKTKVKLYLINLGFTKLTDLPATNSHSIIAELSQVKERITKLNLIPTKKEEGETTVLTRAFIAKETVELLKKQKELEAALELFNSSIEFEDDAA